MPSPFPGMDPYLEGNYWTTFHSQFVSQIARALTAVIQPKYIALAEKLMIAGTSEDFDAVIGRVEPDVSVRQRNAAKTRNRGLGVQLLEAPLVLRNKTKWQYPHWRVEIKELDNRTLVTLMEILSPFNKRSQGRRQYMRKREKILASSTHLVEIDLLRKGRRLPLEEELPPDPYFVFLSRSNRKPLVEVWPIAIEQPLPEIPVPLLVGDADARLDLQKVFTEVYDACRLDLALDYHSPPDVPLGHQKKAWAEDLLSRAGFRRARKSTK